MAKYRARIIGAEERERLLSRLPPLYGRKANIHGACVKLLTDSRGFKDAWEDNFRFMDEEVRPHARVFAIGGKGRLSVDSEPLSKTAIVRNCDYYGLVKSIALAAAADYFEGYSSLQRRHSVHGAFVDFGGRGLAIIGPSGTGKTTLTYGLLAGKGANYLADDWFFVRFMGGGAVAFASEKNSYVREDLAREWGGFFARLSQVGMDSRGRGIADMKLMLGEGRIRSESVPGAIVLLERDRKSGRTLEKLGQGEALSFMLKNDFCNPHQLVRTAKRRKARAEFFRELFSLAPAYILNTVETPAESLARLKGIIPK